MAEEDKDKIKWDSVVKQLHSTSEAKKHMKSNELCMIVVYAAWCGHCKEAAPKINTLAESVKDKAAVYVIESAEYTGNDVTGYPTIFIVRDGKLSTYEGKREVDAMENALLEGNLTGGKRPRRRGTRRLRKRARKTHRALR